ncbi:MAG: hypothetical protein ACI8W7_000848 [Gammaproteobacteria bacterium]|jgi:uncharacterized protein (TIGR00255 family)
MLRSMTAYARAACDETWGHAAWELRGVNNRYLDAVFRLPEELRALEPRLREIIAERIKRGKLECSLRLSLTTSQSTQVCIDTALAKELAAAAELLQQAAPNAEPLRIGELMRWPGVVQQTPPDPALIEGPILELLKLALDDLITTREREGARIVEMVSSRCEQVASIVAQVRQRQPELVESARTRLRERLSEVMEKLDAARVEQEIVVIATKLDVSEEMDRLDAHIDEVRRVLGQRQPVGRRLDFLMQELNREANTLGAKSTDALTTRASVDLKVLIEQIREQIQNVE